MTSRDFAYWLMGFFEIANPKTLNEEQTKIIKNHLDLVFYHEIDPSYTNDPNEQQKMNDIHNGSSFNYVDGEDGINPSTSGFKPTYDSDNTILRC